MGLSYSGLSCLLFIAGLLYLLDPVFVCMHIHTCLHLHVCFGKCATTSVCGLDKVHYHHYCAVEHLTYRYWIQESQNRIDKDKSHFKLDSCSTMTTLQKM